MYRGPVHCTPDSSFPTSIVKQICEQFIQFVDPAEGYFSF